MPSTRGIPAAALAPCSPGAPGDPADVWSDRFGVTSPHAIAGDHLAYAVVAQYSQYLESNTRADLAGVFEPLRDLSRFREVRIHPEFGTVAWAGGADLDPDVLYSLVTGKPIEIHAPTGAS